MNAFKRRADYYQDDDVPFLTGIDPHFPTNNQHHASAGEPCSAGETSFTVDGVGAIRRCHFVAEPLGNITDPDWRSLLRPRRCPNASCGCYIGYTNLERLRQHETYGDGILERIPRTGKQTPAPQIPSATS